MISAIVCALNEAPTIRTVLNALTKSKKIGEIIVISDGSRDETAAIAHTYGVRVIEHKRRKGKAQSMHEGVMKARGELILFLDSDLYRITTKHVDLLITTHQKNTYGMVVGLRDRGMLLNTIARLFPLISGERILPRDIFEQTPARFKKGYQIEAALNATARFYNREITTVRLEGVTVRTKFQKRSVVYALVQYIAMSAQVLSGLLLTSATLWQQHLKTKKY
jgi:glycosyltransferase involved in cell wall biosynthesis